MGSGHESLCFIFKDSSLKLERIVDPHSDPIKSKIDLEFSKDGDFFSFSNLSSGEKEVVDIVFNFHRRKDTWIKNGIYFIDEPELHLNTKIQSLLLLELHKLCKEINAQLWIATHSLGFLRAAQDLKRENLNKVSIIEFIPKYATQIEPIVPINGTRNDWKRIFETALEDITGLIAPKLIIYCEGSLTNSLDEIIFNSIFADKDECLFISATTKSDSIRYAGVALTVINKAFSGVNIRNLVDKDNDKNLPKNSSVKICKLERNEFENYLFDYEIFSKTFPNATKQDYEKIVTNIDTDDIKEKINDLIKITRENIREKDIRLRLAQNISNDTEIYRKLHKIIFEN